MINVILKQISNIDQDRFIIIKKYIDISSKYSDFTVDNFLSTDLQYTDNQQNAD